MLLLRFSNMNDARNGSFMQRVGHIFSNERSDISKHYISWDISQSPLIILFSQMSTHSWMHYIIVLRINLELPLLEIFQPIWSIWGQNLHVQHITAKASKVSYNCLNIFLVCRYETYRTSDVFEGGRNPWQHGNLKLIPWSC